MRRLDFSFYSFRTWAGRGGIERLSVMKQGVANGTGETVMARQGRPQQPRGKPPGPDIPKFRYHAQPVAYLDGLGLNAFAIHGAPIYRGSSFHRPVKVVQYYNPAYPEPVEDLIQTSFPASPQRSGRPVYQRRINPVRKISQGVGLV
jgi:hypothetical protein